MRKRLLTTVLATIAACYGGVTLASQEVRPEYDPTRTMLGQLSSADHVIVGDVVKFKRYTSQGGLWSDEYMVYHIQGDALTREGKQPIGGHYLFRGPDTDDTRAQRIVDFTTEDQLFVIKNGALKPSPIKFVNGEVHYLHDEPVIGILDGDPVPLPRWNNPDCAPSLANHKDVVVKDENGEMLTITAQEQIDMVAVQSCDDGSVWSRGNDRPNNWVVPDPMTQSEFESTVVKYMGEDLSDASVPRAGLQPSNRPSNSRLLVRKHHRENMPRILESYEAMSVHKLSVSDRAHIAFGVERADFLGVPYSDTLNVIRDAYFAEFPRPAHAKKRERPRRPANKR